MKRYVTFFVAVAVLAGVAVLTVNSLNSQTEVPGGDQMNGDIELPEASTEGEVSLESTIADRRSRRSFSQQALSARQIGQVLWSAQGVTDPVRGFRASPSAGATYPLELFLVVGEGGVDEIDAGIYRYVPDDHGLSQVAEGDVRDSLAGAALGQGFVAEAPAVVVIAADYDRTRARYGERAERYVHMEVGHAGGNIYLQCEAMGLGTVAVGAFNDDQVEDVVGIPDGLDALYIMPVGYAE